jgi:hypothetical protein
MFANAEIRFEPDGQGGSHAAAVDLDDGFEILARKEDAASMPAESKEHLPFITGNQAGGDALKILLDYIHAPKDARGRLVRLDIVDLYLKDLNSIEHGNFSDIARRYGLTPAGVGRHVAELRKLIRRGSVLGCRSPESRRRYSIAATKRWAKRKAAR